MNVKSKMIIDCYHILAILIDNRMLLGYINVLNWLLNIDNEMGLVEILEGLNQAFEEDKCLYLAEGKELVKISKISINRNLENIIKIQDLKKETSDEEFLLILNHLPCELFSMEIYNEYKEKFSELEYGKQSMIFEITIKEAKHHTFGININELINRIKQLVNYDLSELETLKSSAEIWIAYGLKKEKELKAYAWVSIILLPDKTNKEIILSDSFKKGRRNQKELLALYRGIKEVTSLGYTNIRVYTNSTYMISVCSRWMYNWKMRGWRKQNGKPPVSLSTIKKIYGIIKKRNVNIKFIQDNRKVNRNLYYALILATKEAWHKLNRLY
jgi:ribonuclease HI